jgi:BirA family biotin operon repressor/biotin-[acetyl-CoA-carboxylase] ligase
VAPQRDIWTGLRWPPGWSVTHVGSTGSTNDDLMKLVEAGDVGDHSVLVADYQTTGRGRLDRVWEAPSGVNLLASIAFSPVPDVAAELTHRVGLAAAATVSQFLPDSAVGLKWPNDVLLDGLKVAGILARRSVTADTVVVGLGLNVGWAPSGGVSLDGAARPIEVLAAVLKEFDALPADITSTYRENLVTLGQRVRVELPRESESVVGRAIDIDASGRLMVLDDGGLTHRFDVGDIIHLRPTTS